MTEFAHALRDKTAVCGAGLLLGDFPDRTALSLAVDAYQLSPTSDFSQETMHAAVVQNG